MTDHSQDSLTQKVDALTEKVDALTEKVGALTANLAVMTGRFEGGWWVLAAIGAVAAGLISWLNLSHIHIKMDGP